MLSMQPIWTLINPAEACRVTYTRRTGWQCNFTTLSVVLSATPPISISTISGALTFEVSLSLTVCCYNKRFGLGFISSWNKAGIKYLTLRIPTNLVRGSFCLINVVSTHHANSEGNVKCSCSRTKARYYSRTAWAGSNVTVGDCGVMFTKSQIRMSGRSPLSVKEVRRGSKKDGKKKKNTA